MVADGYKQTDIGMFPEDWNIFYLNDIVNSVSSGKSSTKSIGNEYPVYGSTGVIGYRPSFDYIGARILVARVGANAGTVNKVDGNYCVSDNTLMVVCSNNLDFNFGYYLLIKQNLSSLVFGSGQPLITGSQLKSLVVPIPPKQEQQAIATALSDTDELINSLGRLIAKKEAIKTGAMQELLTGKKRLDGFSGEWEERLIKDFTDGTAGGTPSTKVPSFWGGNIRWMSSGELNDKIIFDVEGRITNEGLNSSSTKMIPKNCILIGLAGQGKTRGTVAINRVELCTNQSIAAIYPSNKYISEYLYYNMDSRYEELRAMSTGDGGRGGLNLTILRNFKVPFPSKEEQQAIATILSDIDSDIDALKAKLIKVKAIKEGMMQELLTGKTRLLRGATG